MLARDGVALAPIVVGAKPTRVVDLAAKELKTYLDRITGGEGFT